MSGNVWFCMVWALDSFDSMSIWPEWGPWTLQFNRLASAPRLWSSVLDTSVHVYSIAFDLNQNWRMTNELVNKHLKYIFILIIINIIAIKTTRIHYICIKFNCCAESNSNFRTQFLLLSIRIFYFIKLLIVSSNW